jgi:hypothetical protein
MRLLAYLFRLVVGLPLIAVGIVLIVGAVCLIASGGISSPIFAVGGIGLLFLILGVKFLPKRKKGSPFAGEHRRNDGHWRNDPATERQKSFARELGIKFPANISKGALSDLITQKTGKFD